MPRPIKRRPPDQQLLGFLRAYDPTIAGLALEGEGKAMRHIKFRRMSDMERPFVRRYIRAVTERVGAAAGGTGKSVVKGRQEEWRLTKRSPRN